METDGCKKLVQPNLGGSKETTAIVIVLKGALVHFIIEMALQDMLDLRQVREVRDAVSQIISLLANSITPKVAEHLSVAVVAVAAVVVPAESLI